MPASSASAAPASRPCVRALGAMAACTRQRTAVDRIRESPQVAPFAPGAIIDVTVPRVVIRDEWPDVWRAPGLFVPVSNALFVRRPNVTLGVRR